MKARLSDFRYDEQREEKGSDVDLASAYVFNASSFVEVDGGFLFRSALCAGLSKVGESTQQSDDLSVMPSFFD